MSELPKLYCLRAGQPSMSVRMLLKALNVDYEEVPVDFNSGEQLKEDYYKLNPQREIPVLDDNGFLLGESVAILQYLADKYCKDGDKLYPKEPQARALVNHRLCFYLGSYFAHVTMHAMGPIYLESINPEETLIMANLALATFNEMLKRTGFKYAAANHVTIADFSLFTTTTYLEAINFDLSPFPLIARWYDTFKRENSALWEEVESGVLELREYACGKALELNMQEHPFRSFRNK